VSNEQLVGVLIAAITVLAGAIGAGIAAGARWLTRQFEAQAEKFSSALASQQAACAEEQAALIAAFERRCDRDDEQRAKDRDAHHAIAERTAIALAGVQALIRARNDNSA
jgi:hypothetical protein